ncbi:MAG: sulfocyanin-like copper-binding protein [Lacisediminihabitans sp.]
MKPLSHRSLIGFGIAATIILSGLSLAAIGAVGGGGNPFRFGFPGGSSCTTPNLSGTVVNVALTNMGGPMMGQGNGMMSGGAMRLSTDRATVAHGTVSFLATNGGSISHELVILPLPDSQIAGTRPIAGDGRIDEAASLGEASNTCGEGAGQGIVPGASSWVTVPLAPGRYEVVCNLPGHYAAGMYSQLTVS